MLNANIFFKKVRYNNVLSAFGIIKWDFTFYHPQETNVCLITSKSKTAPFLNEPHNLICQVMGELLVKVEKKTPKISKYEQ